MERIQAERTEDSSRRVLINLHGGAFNMGGGGLGGQAESIAIAALSGIPVASVDYRMAPEHRFPAATEDVAAVYRALLENHSAASIGIYGCSAGGVLTAEATAWFQAQGLPRPGALALICAGAIADMVGDSSFFGPLLSGFPAPAPDAPRGLPMAYFDAVSLAEPLVSPAYFPAVLKDFPPTLLLTGTRDALLSAAAFTHTELVKAGAAAELHVLEGMRHGFPFFDDMDTPEASRAWDILAGFFNRVLRR